MVQVGQAIEDFEFQAYHKGEIKSFKFSDFQGKWLVLAFYPADFTFVCPTELGELADHYEEFQKHNTEVLSISTDTVYVHKAWHDTSPTIQKIQFPMVADPAGKISRYFGVYMEDTGLALRGTFIIDPEGILRVMEVHDLSIGRNTKEILRKLLACQFVKDHEGEVCPASWEPGKEALKVDLNLVGKL